VAIAMLIGGLVVQWNASSNGGGNQTHSLLAASLLGMALGATATTRFVVRFGLAGKVQLTEHPGSTAHAPWRAVEEILDRRMSWMVLSVIALFVGLTTAFLPLWLVCTIGWYESLQLHFVWSDGPRQVLQLALAVLSTVLSTALLGCAAVCAHHLMRRARWWDARATGWILLGAGLGALLTSLMSRRGGTAQIQLLAASLPSFALSLFCALLAHHDRHAAAGAGHEGDELPQWCDRSPRLLRAGIVILGGAAACTMALWGAALSNTAPVPMALVPAMLFALACGFGMGGQWSGTSVHTIGGFGTACAMGGAAAAASAIGLGFTADANDAIAVLPACLAIAPIGFAAAVGQRALLGRVAHGAVVGSQILSRSLILAALTCWIALPVLARMTRETAVVALSLSLFVLGGILTSYEPGYAPARRRVRLWAICGAVTGVIVLAAIAIPSGRDRRTYAPPALKTTLASQSPSA